MMSRFVMAFNVICSKCFMKQSGMTAQLCESMINLLKRLLPKSSKIFPDRIILTMTLKLS